MGAHANVSPFSGDLLGDSRMSNVLDKSFIHRSYPKLAYGSIYKPMFSSLLFGLHKPTEPVCPFTINFITRNCVLIESLNDFFLGF